MFFPKQKLSLYNRHYYNGHYYNSTIILMKYFGRKKELDALSREMELSYSNARFTVLMGRRRIGKTSLLLKAFEGKQCLYLLAKNESEPTLCASLQKQIERELGIPIYGTIHSMRDLFELLFSYANSQHLNLIIDEVQELFYVRKSIFADMQELWDKHKGTVQLNLIVCGSIYSLMKELFADRKAMMYGRMTKQIILKPFSIATQKEILQTYNPSYQKEDLLCFYILTGGVAKYIELLIDEGATDKEKMLACFTDPFMPFLSEGSDLMNLEFRKEGGTYFSILSLISQGKTTSSEIDSILNTTSTAYLKNLELSYSLVKKNRPIFASENSRNVKYKLNDNYLLFWFRFIYPNLDLIETQRTELLMEFIQSGYSQFSGLLLERYFQQKLREEGRFTLLDNYWDRKGENEIDIVGIHKMDKTALIAEVKVNPDKISIHQLMTKAEKLKEPLKGYEIEYKGYSLEDV